MNAALPAHTYRVRPDLFVKASQGRLYLRYRHHHYILRLGAELVESVFGFLDDVDGQLSLGDVMAAYPPAHAPALTRLLDALLKIKAAFRLVEGPTPAELAPVADTLNYLSQHVEDPAESYRRFAKQRVLLAGSGYALAAAVKTLARLGAQQLCVLNSNLPGAHALPDRVVSDAFHELTPWAHAECRMLGDVAELATHTPDHVLHCQEHPNLELCSAVMQRTRAPLTWGFIHAGHLIVSDEVFDVAPAALTMAPAARQIAIPATQGVIAGSVFALASFDRLAGVRPSVPGLMDLFDLAGHAPQSSTRRYRLLPVIGATRTDTPETDGPSLLDRDWNTLTATPLFPLHDLREETDERSYIKLYSVAYCAAAQGGPLPGLRHGRLVGAGFNLPDCQTRMSHTLLCAHGLWLAPCGGQELIRRQHMAAQWRHANAATAGLRSGSASALSELDASEHAPLSRQETYIEFCIGAAFGEKVRWKRGCTGDAVLPLCWVVQAGPVALFMPGTSARPLDAIDRENLLFGLYARLWATRHGHDLATTDVLVKIDSTMSTQAQAA